MKKISDIKGDYGNHIMTQINRRLEKIIVDFIHKISNDVNAHIPYVQELSQYDHLQFACKYGINMYSCGYSRIESFFNSHKEFNVENDTWNKWIEQLKNKYTYNDKYIECVIEYGIMNTESWKNSTYRYTMISNIKYLKINFKNVSKDFGKTKTRPSYYDTYGKEILEGDEIVWSPGSYVELHTSIVKSIKDNKFIFEEDEEYNYIPELIPNINHDNIIVIHRKQ